MASPRDWRLWTSAPADGARNMAIDSALLHHTRRTGTAVWRFYTWTAPTLSFGRNESTRGRFDAHSVAAAGFDVVRRPTGGRTLLHAREITYSASFPIGDDVPWRAAYAMVNRLLHGALASLGIPARVAGETAGHGVPPDGPLCFDLPSAGEITVGSAKLVGSAVWREQGGYLQHGSILLHDDQAGIARAALAAMPEPPAAAELAALLPDAAGHGDAFLSAHVASGIARALARAVAPDGIVTAFVEEASMVADIERFDALYRSPEWLWRR